MLVPDVNVFLNAQLAHQVHHARALGWLKDSAWGMEAVAIPNVVLSGFVRVVTNSSLTTAALSAPDAFAFCDQFRDAPATFTLEEGPRHWQIFEQLVTESDVTGPHVADAYLAAFAIENNATFVTFDMGFSRFPGLKLLSLQP